MSFGLGFSFGRWCVHRLHIDNVLDDLRAEWGVNVPRKFGEPLTEVTDVETLRSAVDFLWSLLDDIDTASDMAKGNDQWYRARVESIQRRRHVRVTSDGYKLFMTER